MAAASHYQTVQRVLTIVLILNWAVAFAKIAFGYMSKSASMTADGFHSLSDGTSNIIGIIGVYFCSRPKDEDHPYGHKKYETLFALGIAAMLLMVAFNLAKEGVYRFWHPVTPEIDLASFIVMGVTLAVNYAVMTYEYKKGVQMGSDLLVVDSMHTRTDLYASLSVIAALIGVKLGFPLVDPLVSVAIAGFIAYSALEIIKQESGVLCDGATTLDLEKLKAAVLKVEGTKTCHKIRSRGRMDDVFLDLHVQVDPSMSLLDSHSLNHRIQAAIMAEFPNVSDVLVHVEPYAQQGERLDRTA